MLAHVVNLHTPQLECACMIKAHNGKTYRGCKNGDARNCGIGNTGIQTYINGVSPLLFDTSIRFSFSTMKFSSVFTFALAAMAVSASPVDAEKRLDTSLLTGAVGNVVDTASGATGAAGALAGTPVDGIAASAVSKVSSATSGAPSAIGSATGLVAVILDDVVNLVGTILTDVEGIAAAAGVDVSDILSKAGISLNKRDVIPSPSTFVESKRNVGAILAAVSKLVSDILAGVFKLASDAGTSVTSGLGL